MREAGQGWCWVADPVALLLARIYSFAPLIRVSKTIPLDMLCVYTHLFDFLLMYSFPSFQGVLCDVHRTPPFYSYCNPMAGVSNISPAGWMLLLEALYPLPTPIIIVPFSATFAEDLGGRDRRKSQKAKNTTGEGADKEG